MVRGAALTWLPLFPVPGSRGHAQLYVGLIAVPSSPSRSVLDCTEAPFLSLLPPAGAPCPLCSCVAHHQVHKLLIVVELLLGEIPDRLQFRQPSLKRSLMPYFLLTQGKAGPAHRACRGLTLWPLQCVCPFVSSDPLLSPSSCQDRKPSQVQPGPGPVWGEVSSRWDLYLNHPTAAQRH